VIVGIRGHETAGGIEVCADEATPEGKVFRIGNGPLFVHPNDMIRPGIELEPGLTYAQKCTARGRLAYEKRRRELKPADQPKTTLQGLLTVARRA
jgi:hypothetical protein